MILPFHSAHDHAPVQIWTPKKERLQNNHYLRTFPPWMIKYLQKYYFILVLIHSSTVQNYTAKVCSSCHYNLLDARRLAVDEVKVDKNFQRLACTCISFDEFTLTELVNKFASQPINAPLLHMCQLYISHVLWIEPFWHSYSHQLIDATSIHFGGTLALLPTHSLANDKKCTGKPFSP